MDSNQAPDKHLDAQTSSTTEAEPTLAAQDAQSKDIASKAAQNYNLSEEIKTLLAEPLQELRELQNTIKAKKVEIEEKTKEIKSRFDSISKLEHVETSANIGEIFERASRDYAILIVQALREIDFYVTFYEQYLAGSSPQLAAIIAQKPEFLETHIKQQAKLLRQYIKRRQKEFAVFFSRYDHGYNTHIRKIASVEQLTK